MRNCVHTYISTKNAGSNIPLSRQVEYFNATWYKMVTSKGSDAASALLSRSVFLIGIGGNDLSAFANTGQAQSHDAEFYSSLVSNYKATITVKQEEQSSMILNKMCCLMLSLITKFNLPWMIRSCTQWG